MHANQAITHGGGMTEAMSLIIAAGWYGKRNGRRRSSDPAGTVPPDAPKDRVRAEWTGTPGRPKLTKDRLKAIRRGR